MPKIDADVDTDCVPMDTPCIGGHPMKSPPERRCGAKTRDGDPFKNCGDSTVCPDPIAGRSSLR